MGQAPCMASCTVDPHKECFFHTFMTAGPQVLVKKLQKTPPLVWFFGIGTVAFGTTKQFFDRCGDAASLAGRRPTLRGLAWRMRVGIIQSMISSPTSMRRSISIFAAVGLLLTRLN